MSWSGFAEPCSGVRTFIVALIDEDGNVMWELERSPLSNEAAVDRLAFVADASYAVHGRVLRAPHSGRAPLHDGGRGRGSHGGHRPPGPRGLCVCLFATQFFELRVAAIGNV